MAGSPQQSNPQFVEIEAYGPAGPSLTPSVTSRNLGSTTQGTPGPAVSYTLSGSSLTGSTTVTPPAGVEVATSSTGPWFDDSSPLVITTTPSYTETISRALTETQPAM